MKKFLNWYLGSTLLISVLLISYIFYLGNHSVGEISFDKKLDNPNFKLCKNVGLFQHYGFGHSLYTDYNGGARAIKNKLLSKIEEQNVDFKNSSGLITYRFIINCKGQIGRVRIKQVDEDQKPTTSFNYNEIKKIKELIKQLSDWNLIVKNEKKVNSYFIIRCKVKKGKIIDIF